MRSSSGGNSGGGGGAGGNGEVVGNEGQNNPATTYIATIDTSLPGCTGPGVLVSGVEPGTIFYSDEDPSARPLQEGFNLFDPDAQVTQWVIEGWFESMGNISGTAYNRCLKSVDYWGETGTETLYGAFAHSDSLEFISNIPSTVTSTEFMFYYSAFDLDVSHLNMENVENAGNMFYQAANFNNGGQPLDWGNKTRNFTNIAGMFFNTNFNQEVNDWNTSNITSMRNLFSSSPFNQSLSNWDTSNVTRMDQMFYQASDFDQPVSHFDTSKVTNFSSMFEQASKFTHPVTNWDTSSATDMSNMFKTARVFNQSVAHFDTAKVTTMDSMFMNAPLFNQDISDWDVSSVTNMASMFNHNNQFNHDLSGWQLKGLTSASSMFSNSVVNQNLYNWSYSLCSITSSTLSPIFNSSLITSAMRPVVGLATGCS